MTPSSPMLNHLRRSTLPAVLALAAALSLVPAPARAQTPVPGQDVRGLVARLRVIGIFDAETGKPIDSVEVKDILTGLSAVTTATGTVLLPMDTAGAFLRIRKLGYNMNTLVVSNGADDTLPLTLTLDRMGQMLPTMITNARGVAKTAADTVRKLDLTGFYNRRLQGSAPPTSYVSQADIEKWRPTLMSDLAASTGRPWMWDCTVYIDGALTPVPAKSPEPGRVARNLNSGIDQLLDPSMVAGVEVYRSGEVPAQYNATLVGAGAMQSGAASAGCVTLIWTR